MMMNEATTSILTRVHCTSSANARERLPENLLNEQIIGSRQLLNVFLDGEGRRSEGFPEYIGLRFRDRTLKNKVLFAIYRVLRVLFVSFWYYFAPFYGLYFYFLIYFLH